MAGYAFQPPTDIDSVSGLLEQIFLFYAQTTSTSTILSLNRFQRMCLDADIVDQGQTSTMDTGLTSAQVDLIFKSTVAQGAKGKSSAGMRYMNLQQFMDAAVLLATTKYRDQAEHPRQAVVHLYQEHFLTFQVDPAAVSNEWLRALESFALPLFQVYKHYFPLELNPHYKLTAAESRDNTHSSFSQIFTDYEIAPKLLDTKPIIFNALRTSYAEPIPRRITEAIRLDKMGHFAGQHFTFHHFIVAIQSVANQLKRLEKKVAGKQEDEDSDLPEKKSRFSAQSVESLEMMLVRMDENKRSQAPAVKLIGSEHAAAVSKMSLADDRAELLSLYEDDRGRQVKRFIGQTYTFYVTLGEPLQQALSIRKFNRFLRDIGIVPTKGSRKMLGDYQADYDASGRGDGGETEMMRHVQSLQPVPQFSTSKTPIRQGGHDIDSPRMGQMLSNSPRKPQQLRKVPLDSGLTGSKLTMKVPGLPLRIDVKLTSVAADLIFYQAKHYENKKNKDKKLEKVTDKDRLSQEYNRQVNRGLAKAYLDLEGFTRAIELLSEKVYKTRNQPLSDNVVQFAEEVLMPLLQALGQSDLPNAPIRPVDWQDIAADSEAVNRVFGHVKLALERVYSTFVANGEAGWSLQTYTDFVEEFGLLRDLKMLTVHRIFYALADMPERPPRLYLTFEPFARSLVYLAQWAVEGDYQTHEKLLLLFHRMNATPGAVRLTNNCDLFNVVSDIREIAMPAAALPEAPKWSSVVQGGPSR